MNKVFDEREFAATLDDWDPSTVKFIFYEDGLQAFHKIVPRENAERAKAEYLRAANVLGLVMQLVTTA